MNPGSVHIFGGFELDAGNRELRRDGEPVALQPQAFAVLAYLVEHRDRTVAKEELLDALWPDATVGAGSLQRAVHLVRAALGDDGALIRTVPKLGYRFAAEVETAQATAPPPFVPRFARSGGVHIAYYTVGEGDLDIVLVLGWAFPMRALAEHPQPWRTIEQLAQLGRVILFDKRGTGLSDRVSDAPGLELRMDDLGAVLDAVGSTQAVLIGYSEGGPLSLLFATAFPERIRGLLLVAAFARWASDHDYPCGWTTEALDRLKGYIRRSWGAGDTIKATLSSHAADPRVAAWAARAEQEGASPGSALALMEMNLQIDVRPVLSLVAVPTVVLHRSDDPVIDAGNGRYLAANIPGARYHEVEGTDHVFFFQDPERLIEAAAWLCHQPRQRAVDHVLSTVVVARVDGDVDPAEVHRIASRLRGVREGDGLWSFDGPQRAVQFAAALADTCSAAAIGAKLGVHTGEVGRTAGGLVGDAIIAATALATAAAEGEVYVSTLVRDLVCGSQLVFDERPAVARAGDTPMAALALVRKR